MKLQKIGRFDCNFYLTVNQVDAYNDTMTSKNARTRQGHSISPLDKTNEMATYGKTPSNNVVPKDVNN